MTTVPAPAPAPAPAPDPASASAGGRVARTRALLRSPAAGACVIGMAFFAIAIWWVLRDERIINSDYAKHVNIALKWHEGLSSGDWLATLRAYNIYPPGTHIVGALGTFAFGFNIRATTLAQDIVFIPLLALGCYGTAKIAFGRTAGLLAAVFAFSVPMVMSMFHMYLPDGPLTAMVALTVWLMLASDRFSRLGISALAGVMAGLGMYTKGTFALFVAGVALMLFLRGGWRNWKGWLLAGGLTTAIAGPYFLDQSESIEAQATGHATSGQQIWYGTVPYPDQATVENFTWYFWNLVNNQLYLPLTIFFLIGVAWAVWRVVRCPEQRGYIPELLAGGLVGYLAISMLVVKDPRYTLPCLVFIAALGTAWIVHAGRRTRIAAIALLCGVAVFNTVSQNVGVGGVHSLDLPNAVNSPIGEYRLTVVNENGFFGGPPRREAVPFTDMYRDLTKIGVTETIFDGKRFPPEDNYNLTSLTLLALGTGQALPGFSEEFVKGPGIAWVTRASVARVGRPPCFMSPLADDGTGIYIYVARVPKLLSRTEPDCP